MNQWLLLFQLQIGLVVILATLFYLGQYWWDRHELTASLSDYFTHDVVAAEERYPNRQQYRRIVAHGVVVHAITANYPREALVSRQEGWVDVQFSVSPEGYLHHIQVIDSNPPGVFEKSTLDALKQWRIEPLQEDGDIDPAKQFSQRVEFVLGD